MIDRANSNTSSLSIYNRKNLITEVLLYEDQFELSDGILELEMDLDSGIPDFRHNNPPACFYFLKKKLITHVGDPLWRSLEWRRNTVGFRFGSVNRRPHRELFTCHIELASTPLDGLPPRIGSISSRRTSPLRLPSHWDLLSPRPASRPTCLGLLAIALGPVQQVAASPSIFLVCPAVPDNVVSGLHSYTARIALVFCFSDPV